MTTISKLSCVEQSRDYVTQYSMYNKNNSELLLVGIHPISTNQSEILPCTTVFL